MRFQQTNQPKYPPKTGSLKPNEMIHNNFSPFPILKTDRLTLRKPATGDSAEIFALRANPSVNKYLDRQPCHSIENATSFILNINKSIENNDAFYWAITSNLTGKLIGTICLFNFSKDKSTAEIGYELLPDFHGKGLMREAVSIVIEFGFRQMRLSSILAIVHFENLRSIKLLETFKFTKLPNAKEMDEHLIRFELADSEPKITVKG